MRTRFDLVDAELRYFHGTVGKLEAGFSSGVAEGDVFARVRARLGLSVEAL
jgi:hypothetical protein